MTPVFRQKIDKTIPAWIFALAELESCKFAACWVIALMVAGDFFLAPEKALVPGRTIGKQDAGPVG